MSYNLSALSGRKGLENNLFEQLGRAASETGAVSVADTERLAEEFLMGKANTLGAASFYDFTRPENRGKKAYVCRGSACLCAGTQDAVEAKLKQELGDDAVGSAYCLGRCHENSAFLYEGQNYSGNDIFLFPKIRQADQKSRALITDKYHIAAIGTPVLTGEPEEIDSYYSLLHQCLQKSPDALLAELQLSGLRGRGGGGRDNNYPATGDGGSGGRGFGLKANAAATGGNAGSSGNATAGANAGTATPYLGNGGAGGGGANGVAGVYNGGNGGAGVRGGGGGGGGAVRTSTNSVKSGRGGAGGDGGREEWLTTQRTLLTSTYRL